METREKSGNDVMLENLFLVKSGVSFLAGHQTQRLVVWRVRNNNFFTCKRKKRTTANR